MREPAFHSNMHLFFIYPPSPPPPPPFELHPLCSQPYSPPNLIHLTYTLLSHLVDYLKQSCDIDRLDHDTVCAF